MKTYIINLEKSTTRREHMLEGAKRCGLNYEFIKGVDGSALSEAELESLCDMDAVRRAPQWLSRGMIGCSLSHHKAYKTILEQGDDCALILEDDVILPDNLSEVLTNIKPHLQNNEIISLYYFSFKPCLLSQVGAVDLDNKYKLMYPMDVSKPITTSGYVISREACKTMIKAVMPIHAAPDSWGTFYESGGFASFRCVYPCPLQLVGFKSTIMTTTQTSLRANVTQFIDDRKVPPFYQLLKFFRLRNIEQKMFVKLVDEKSPVQIKVEKMKIS